MKLKFKTKIDKQIEASRYWIDDTSEQILYGGAKGGGKSYLGASLIFMDALIYPETHYFIAREELIDLRKFTVPTINEVIKNWGLKIDDYANLDGTYNIYNLYNGSKVFLIACKELPSDPLYERFGSMQMTRGWIEEAGEVSERAKRNLWLSIGRWKNKEFNLKKKLLITANPKKGWMKREFVELHKANTLPEYLKYIQAFATDNLYLPKDYLKTLKDEKDKVTRQRLWEGNWDYDEDNDSLTTYDALSDAFSNTIVKDNQKYFVIDMARKGKDFTTFNFWEGLELYRVEKYSMQDTEETKRKVRDFASIEKIPYSNILVDDTGGYGSAVVDGLRGVKGFVSTSRPLPTANEIRIRQSKIDNFLIPKTTYGSLKAQCGWKLAELLNEHKIAFKVQKYRDELIEDLSELLRQRDIDTDKKLNLKKKEDVKADLSRSPDIGDPAIYRMWFELKKDALEEDTVGNQYILKQQNQFDINKSNFLDNSNK